MAKHKTKIIFVVLACLAAFFAVLFWPAAISEQSAPPLPPPPTAQPSVVAPAPTLEPEPEAVMIEEPPSDDNRTVSLYFGTNREVVPEDARTKAPESLFSNERDKREIHYGVIEVTIPPDHRMGEMESVHWALAMFVDEDPEKHVFLKSVKKWDRDKMLAQMREQLAASEDPAILTFVHGFNTSFKTAARRAGQLTYDLQFDGVPTMFSWPSQGSGSKYTVDSTLAANSIPAMTEFLRHIASQGANRVVVIAHSMGTRVVSGALTELLSTDPELARRIFTVVLAAPDIDKDKFIEQIAPKFRALNTPVTVYASKNDSALKLSKGINGFERLGDANTGLIAMEKIDLIDASSVTSDFFGHTYFGDNASIVTDIKELIDTSTPVDRRTFLSPVGERGEGIWKIMLDPVR